MKLIVAVIAGCFAIAGWRNLPPLDQPSAGAVGTVLAALIVLAYVGGRRSVRAEAVAVAVASARAEAAAAAHAGAQALSQVVVNVDQGARATAEREFGNPEWWGTTRPDVEQLDGSDGVLSITDEQTSSDNDVATDVERVLDEARSMGSPEQGRGQPVE